MLFSVSNFVCQVKCPDLAIRDFLRLRISTPKPIYRAIAMVKRYVDCVCFYFVVLCCIMRIGWLVQSYTATILANPESCTASMYSIGRLIGSTAEKEGSIVYMLDTSGTSVLVRQHAMDFVVLPASSKAVESKPSGFQ